MFFSESLSTPSVPVYLISSAFDYDSYLCPDVGTAYADLLGLPVKSIASHLLEEGQIYIVDPQLTSEEVDFLRCSLANRALHIVFRIIDPYWPPQDTNPLRLLAFESAAHPGTAVLSAYEPSEMVDLLMRIYGRTRFYVSPYPYDESKELPFSWQRRRLQIVITGNHNSALYPLRALARRKRMTSLQWRFLTTDLPHPGYTISRDRRSIVGDAYIAYLSRFAMMLLCPSRASLEFLKYRECAYAGCCPVGQAPYGFSLAAADSIYRITLGGFKEELRSLRKASPSDLLDRARRYRAVLGRDRSPALLRDRLLRWLEALYS